MTPGPRPPSPGARRLRPGGAGDRARPPLRVFTTTLWEYPSQHYDSWIDPETGKTVRAAARVQGDKSYEGATPSWVIWQLLMRYTRPKDLVVDSMCGSGTTLDVARDLDRRAIGYDLQPAREDIFRADARKLPLEDSKADFFFADPPYSTHIAYSDDPRCIGKLDAGGGDGGREYFEAMDAVFAEAHRVLRNRRYLGVYASDSWRKRGKGAPGAGAGEFMPIGFELFSLLARRFKPVDVVVVARKNEKLQRGNWHKAAREQNFFLRGFNYLLIFKKEDA